MPESPGFESSDSGLIMGEFDPRNFAVAAVIVSLGAFGASFFFGGTATVIAGSGGAAVTLSSLHPYITDPEMVLIMDRFFISGGL